jgi:hypothetical protein
VFDAAGEFANRPDVGRPDERVRRIGMHP